MRRVSVELSMFMFNYVCEGLCILCMHIVGSSLGTMSAVVEASLVRNHRFQAGWLL